MNAVITSLELDKEDISSKTICFVSKDLSDSNFIVSSFISNFVRSENSGLVLISFRRSFDHYNLVGVKSGYNLNTCLQKGSFVHIDVTKEVSERIKTSKLIDQQYLIDTTVKLKSYIEQLSNKFEKVILIVDCISDVLNCNVSLKTTFQFLNHLRLLLALYSKTTLVVGSQCCEEDSDKILLKNYLMNLSDFRMIVSPLKTGFSTEVSGSIKYTKKDETKIKMYSDQQFYHFKVTDRNLKVFAPGSMV